ncbi:MAG: GNAT family N-acetyltransferase [Bacteroidales bacterium]|nr:GNAT family N-acetyltransferase [Bacteroidales bacterium]
MNLTDVTLKFEINSDDRDCIFDILNSSGFFYSYEIDVAVEIADEYLNREDHNGYFFIAALQNGKMIGFTCYGEIPCTKGSYDLYWIAVHNDFRGKGIGFKLIEETEKHILSLSGKRIYIETSSTEKYAPTQGFYLRTGYFLEARLKDYYKDGDDKLMYSKVLS